MRADIKVGIAIAVILIGIGVVWYVFLHSSGEPVDRKPADPKDAKATKGTGETLVVVTKKPPPVVRPAYTTDTRPAVEPTALTATRPVDPTVRTGEWRDVPSRPRWTTPAWSATGDTSPTGTVGSTAVRTYLVKEGDSYWSIAQSLWGDGTLHPHIQKANPHIAPNALRPRMTIKIPAKPVRPAAVTPAGGTPAVTSAGHGATGVEAITQKRYYIVKKGDRGFWDVSKAVYGEGKHYRLIEKANPNLKSRGLQPGQKVYYPEKPTRPAHVAVRPAHTGPAYTAPTTAPAVTSGAGAPTRSTLPDGRVFD